MLLRLAQPGDAEATRAIYNAEVVGSTSTFDLVPRSAEGHRRWLDEHAGAHPAVVAVHGQHITGFAALSPYRTRPAYATTVEDSVYVRADRRGQGEGAALLAEVVRLARLHGFHSVMARIADSNAASIALHRSCQFDLVGVEREVGRKFGRWLDVVVMQLML